MSDPLPTRRGFLRAAVAIGGTSALSACIETEKRRGSSENDIPEEPTNEPSEESEGGPSSPRDNFDHPNRQHAWDSYLEIDSFGVTRLPYHHVLVFLDYEPEGVPTSDHRERLEGYLSLLEEAYEWSNEGLLFTLGYSPHYFDRFESDLPESVDLPHAYSLSPYSSPEIDDYDAVLHLASDHATAVLAAEEAIFGNVDQLNGVTVNSGLGSVFEKKDRRTGFKGGGLPAKHQDVEGIPESDPVLEEAPSYMGFRTDLGSNQAPEKDVTIDGGRFAGSTTQHVSKIRLELGDWYGSTLEERVKMMYEGTTRPESVGETGDRARESRKFIDNTHEHAREEGVVGHAEKAARVREDDTPLILRREFDTDDEGHAGVHFVSLQEKVQDFFETRTAMNGTEFSQYEGVGEMENNGILDFIEVDRRANYLIPPRSLRSLPSPEPD